MTPTPCRVAGCSTSIRPTYSCARALTYLFTYLNSWLGRIKPAISPKQLKTERKLLLTAYIKSYTGFRLPPKCMALNDLCARFKVIDSLNAAKWQVSNDSESFWPLPLVNPKIINVLNGWYFTAASRGLRCYCAPLVYRIVSYSGDCQSRRPELS